MKCPRHHPDDLGRLTKGQLIKLVVAMAGELAEAQSLNLAYAQQIEELLRSASKNSRNSSMPPSSDGLSKPTVEVTTQVAELALLVLAPGRFSPIRQCDSDRRKELLRRSG